VNPSSSHEELSEMRTSRSPARSTRSTEAGGKILGSGRRNAGLNERPCQPEFKQKRGGFEAHATEEEGQSRKNHKKKRKEVVMWVVGPSQGYAQGSKTRSAQRHHRGEEEGSKLAGMTQIGDEQEKGKPVSDPRAGKKKSTHVPRDDANCARVTREDV